MTKQQKLDNWIDNAGWRKIYCVINNIMCEYTEEELAFFREYPSPDKFRNEVCKTIALRCCKIFGNLK
ncbi:MAG: hypothetical protein KDC47_09945 [Flavobacteriaceae bacterium]|nr:hypothetical protein [Flavobacteriaceae bacterium]